MPDHISVAVLSYIVTEELFQWFSSYPQIDQKSKTLLCWANQPTKVLDHCTVATLRNSSPSPTKEDSPFFIPPLPPWSLSLRHRVPGMVGLTLIGWWIILQWCTTPPRPCGHLISVLLPLLMLFLSSLCSRLIILLLRFWKNNLKDIVKLQSYWT